MAKTILEDKAKNEFLTYVENAALEFGASTAKRWQKERPENVVHIIDIWDTRMSPKCYNATHTF